MIFLLDQAVLYIGLAGVPILAQWIFSSNDSTDFSIRVTNLGTDPRCGSSNRAIIDLPIRL